MANKYRRLLISFAVWSITWTIFFCFFSDEKRTSGRVFGILFMTVSLVAVDMLRDKYLPRLLEKLPGKWKKR